MCGRGDDLHSPELRCVVGVGSGGGAGGSEGESEGGCGGAGGEGRGGRGAGFGGKTILGDQGSSVTHLPRPYYS